MSDNRDSTRPNEMPAVKTTIVGGRPPGCGKSVGNIPRGIEVLIKKAAVDAEFREELLTRRAGAADLIGLNLTAAEMLMLDAAPADQLARIIAQTKVEESTRPALLGRFAASMLLALGITAGLASDGCTFATTGIAPDDPRLNPPATDTPVPQGVRPDRPPTTQQQGLEVIVPSSNWQQPGEARVVGTTMQDGVPTFIMSDGQTTWMSQSFGHRVDKPATRPDVRPGEFSSPPGPALAGGGTFGNQPDRPGDSAGIRPGGPNEARDKLLEIVQMAQPADIPREVAGVRADHPRPVPPATHGVRPDLPPTSQPASPALPVPTPEQLDRLVAELNSNKLAEQQAAERLLRQLDMATVVARLRQAVDGGRLSDEAMVAAKAMIDTPMRVQFLIGKLSYEVRAVRGMSKIHDTSPDEAEKALIEIGPWALPALRDAVASGKLNPEAKARAERVIARLSPTTQPAATQPTPPGPTRGIQPDRP